MSLLLLPPATFPIVYFFGLQLPGFREELPASPSLLGRGRLPPRPVRNPGGRSASVQKRWCAGGGGGVGRERGGRIVAASEMLRPSVVHVQQAEVMLQVCKK